MSGLFGIALTDADLEILRGRTETPDVLSAIAEMDRRLAWQEKLRDVGVDERVWEVVAGIADKQRAEFRHGDGHGTDPFGEHIERGTTGRGKRRTGWSNSCTINGVAWARESWKQALPLVQRALDALGIAFDASRGGGLTCAVGEHRIEEVWTDDDGYEFRMFDMGHGASGFAGSCYPLFPKRKDGDDGWVGSWSRILRLPKRQELIRVDGWPKCRTCGKPVRRKLP